MSEVTHRAPYKDSDQDEQADLSLRWAHIHFAGCRFQGNCLCYWYIAPQMEHSFSFLKF